MGIKEQVERIDPERGYIYQWPRITVAFAPPLPPENPLQQILYGDLCDALRARGDKVLQARGDDFPPEVTVGLRFTPPGEWLRESPPKELYDWFPKPRGHKRGVEVQTIESQSRFSPPEKDGSQAVSAWMREALTRKAVHANLVFEGDPQRLGLDERARIFIGSMLGDVSKVIYRRDAEREVFEEVMKTLEFIGGAEMVNEKNPRRSKELTFRDWCQLPEVQDIAYASQVLGENGFLWDLDLSQTWSRKPISGKQIRRIMRALGQAGLGEGNLSALVDGLMAMTETGETKTKISPEKGHIVPVVAITENGTVHWVLKGFPKGHPVTIFRGPSRALVDYGMSAYRRKRMRQMVSRWVNHPPSIEARENADLYRVSALWEAGQIATFEDYLRNLDQGFRRQSELPIIPDGVEVAADAAGHFHLWLKTEQRHPWVRVAKKNENLFGYNHSPLCGSWEALMDLIHQEIDLYQEFGPMKKGEIRGTNMRGHGCCLWVKGGIRYLADAIVNKMVEFEDHLPRSMELY